MRKFQVSSHGQKPIAGGNHYKLYSQQENYIYNIFHNNSGGLLAFKSSCLVPGPVRRMERLQTDVADVFGTGQALINGQVFWFSSSKSVDMSRLKTLLLASTLPESVLLCSAQGKMKRWRRMKRHQ